MASSMKEVEGDIVVTQMNSGEVLQSFWEFATTVRRTRSLAASESARLRGSWLTESLAVQRVHGWGQRSVRLLCVRAESEERRTRLCQFFQKDRRNLEGRLVTAKDPLDIEPRVLVKIPYDASLDWWVDHERQVLLDLAGLKGVPVLAEQIFFEDLGIRAAAYEYCTTPTLQEQLESGNMVAPEGLHKVAAFILSTFERAHERGWLHTDLQPHDVLISTQSSDTGESADGGNLICSWSHAVRRKESVPRALGDLLELTRQLPVAAESAIDGDTTQPLQTESNGDTTLLPSQCVLPSDNHQNAAGPSIYSAPEQFVSIFAGTPHDVPATDVYRSAGVTLMALRARGPLGTLSKPMERNAARNVDVLRKVCHQCLLRRAEGGDGDSMFPQLASAETFVEALESLLNGLVDVAGCGGPEMHDWMSRCLARDPAARYATAQEALQALDDGWAALESRILAEREAEEEAQTKTRTTKSMTVMSVASRASMASMTSAKGHRLPQRLVLEPPPELEQMTIL